MHRPLLAKIYYTYTRQLVSLFKTIPKDRVLKAINEMAWRNTVAQHYEKHYTHYTSRQGQARGSCNAFRELLQWLLNATAIVYWYYAVNLEHKTLPDIPYILARDPSHAATMYPPLYFIRKDRLCLAREVCPGIENVVWTWLVEEHRKKTLTTPTITASREATSHHRDCSNIVDRLKISWTKIAKILLEYVTDDGRCRICGEGVLPPGRKAKPNLRDLSAVYRHFKERHRKIHYEARRKALGEES